MSLALRGGDEAGRGDCRYPEEPLLQCWRAHEKVTIQRQVRVSRGNGRFGDPLGIRSVVPALRGRKPLDD
jgi:hypothetical protein